MCMADDCRTNLHTALDMYQEQVQELQGMELGGRKIVMFLSGDYEFLCRIYGLSGASGRHCCLWCTIPSADLKKPLSERGRSPDRDLENLASTLKDFLEKGSGDLKKAKHYNNVIDKAIFVIPLTNVCIPGLHVFLGIFDRLWELLENACNELDLLLATFNKDGVDGNSYECYCHALREMTRLKEQLNTEEQHAKVLGDLITYLAHHLPNPATDPTLKRAAKEASDLNKTLAATKRQLAEKERLVCEKFKPKDGPIFKSLEKALQELHVERQAYQGGTFVGNHVHKLLKSQNIDTLLSIVKAEADKHGAVMTSRADQLHRKFRGAFIAFSKCHNIYNGNALSDDDITQAEKDIEDFMSYYRKEFPTSSVLPKMHILEDHVVPWLRRFNIGAGLMGEQGAESLHAKLEETYRGIYNKVDKLKYIFNMYSLETAPALQSMKPEIKRRKRRREE